MENERNEDCLSGFVGKWCTQKRVSVNVDLFTDYYSDQSEEVLREMIREFLIVHAERTLLNKNGRHNPFQHIERAILPQNRDKWKRCGWPT